jgi:hypothetical protein
MKRSVNGKVMLHKFVLEADIESLIRYKAKLSGTGCAYFYYFRIVSQSIQSWRFLLEEILIFQNTERHKYPLNCLHNCKKIIVYMSSFLLLLFYAAIFRTHQYNHKMKSER